MTRMWGVVIQRWSAELAGCIGAIYQSQTQHSSTAYSWSQELQAVRVRFWISSVLLLDQQKSIHQADQVVVKELNTSSHSRLKKKSHEASLHNTTSFSLLSNRANRSCLNMYSIQSFQELIKLPPLFFQILTDVYGNIISRFGKDLLRRELSSLWPGAVEHRNENDAPANDYQIELSSLTRNSDWCSLK